MATSSGAAAGRSTDSTSHTFIVGLPRTGSTLTRGVLNASPEVWVSGESNYFAQPTRLGLMRRPGYAEQFRRVGDIATDSGLERVVDHIFQLRGKSYWAKLARTIDRTELETALRRSERTDRALLDIAMAHFADGRAIRGEKTPHHIHNVPTLFEWFPGARVIHTFRDPRAIYVSLRRKERPEKLTAIGLAARRLGPLFDMYSISNVVRSWKTMVRLHRSYSARFPERYTLVRFEDLVMQPRPTAERLSTFVGIDFTDAMLEQVVHNSSFRSESSGSGFDMTTVGRWREHLPPAAQAYFLRRCRAELVELGYAV